MEMVTVKRQYFKYFMQEMLFAVCNIDLFESFIRGITIGNSFNSLADSLCDYYNEKSISAIEYCEKGIAE